MAIDIFTLLEILETISSVLAIFFSFTGWLGRLLTSVGLTGIQVNIAIGLILLGGLFAAIKIVKIAVKIGLIVLGIWISASILGLI